MYPYKEDYETNKVSTEVEKQVLDGPNAVITAKPLFYDMMLKPGSEDKAFAHQARISKEIAGKVRVLLK